MLIFFVVLIVIVGLVYVLRRYAARKEIRKQVNLLHVSLISANPL
jgi:hypothetical protein